MKKSALLTGLFLALCLSRVSAAVDVAASAVASSLDAAVAAAALPASAAVFFVAPDGSDGNPGTKDKPFATVQRAQSAVRAGDTVYLRGGIYHLTEAQIAHKERIYACVTYLDKSGRPGKYITYCAYPGERPVFDYTAVKPFDYRVAAFYVTGSWLHLKGFEVTGVQVTITTHTQSECFENHGSNNIYEQLSMHDGMAIGFYLLSGSDNLILNCDAYRNFDSVSENRRGGNTDGFGCHPRAGSKGNVFRGCRSWFNSDDGYDVINSAEATTFDHCWAFYNGYNPAFTSEGDGNGFNMLNRMLGNVYADVPGYKHVLHNNLGFRARDVAVANLDTTQCELVNNDFDVSPADADFMSLDETQLMAPRQADGSLPAIDFLRPRPASRIAGMGAFAGDSAAGPGRLVFSDDFAAPLDTGVWIAEIELKGERFRGYIPGIARWCWIRVEA
ncbi:MAG TPA: right-handed parallel beta-helix repeat-containing protein [Puia sp.]|nr:right-handed parallel beta-helix repeat-containing protein [Puia sp.]